MPAKRSSLVVVSLVFLVGLALMLMIIAVTAPSAGAGVGSALVVALTGWVMQASRARACAGRLGSVRGRVLAIASGARSGATLRSRPPLRSAPPEQAPRDAIDGVALAVRRQERELGADINWLLAERATLVSVIDAVDVPVLVIDASNRVLRYNDAAGGLWTRRDQSVVGADIEDVFTPQRLIELVGEAMQGNEGRDRVRMLVDGEMRSFDIAARPMRPELAYADTPRDARPAVVLTLLDVTSSARTVQLRTDFVANASHELRTPIASIRAAIDTLKLLGPDEVEPRARFESMIDAGAQRLEEMISDLFDLSNLESEDRPVASQPTKGSELASTLTGLFDAACRERSLTLEVDLAPELERMVTDQTLLLLILRNLIDNAIKFARENTPVRVVGRQLAGRGVRFQVIDKGEGIPLKHHARIFERFFQVDDSRVRNPKRKGTGLGLAIVKHAARRLGGDVSVDSVWQEGTTMTVDLPNCLESQPGALPEAGAEPKPEPGSEPDS